LVLSDPKEQDGILTAAWLGPAWTSCLRKYPFLEVLIVKSPLLPTPAPIEIPVNAPPEDVNINFLRVKQWILSLPSVQRVYLAHGFDDELNISGYSHTGFSNLYFRDGLGEWIRREWRLYTQRKGTPGAEWSRRLIQATKREDRTAFDSEEYCTSDEGDW
jgi:hypothetical protein